MRIGTASVRRRAQLLAFEPTVSVEPLRGNVDTRLRKARERGLDALVLACCGLDRLGLADEIGLRIPVDADAARGGAGSARAAGARRRGGARRARRPRRDAAARRGRARVRRVGRRRAASRRSRRTTTATRLTALIAAEDGSWLELAQRRRPGRRSPPTLIAAAGQAGRVKVIVTRPRAQAQPLVERLEARGHEVVECPLIEIVRTSDDPIDCAGLRVADRDEPERRRRDRPPRRERPEGRRGRARHRRDAAGARDRARLRADGLVAGRPAGRVPAARGQGALRGGAELAPRPDRPARRRLRRALRDAAAPARPARGRPRRARVRLGGQGLRLDAAARRRPSASARRRAASPARSGSRSPSRPRPHDLDGLLDAVDARGAEFRSRAGRARAHVPDDHLPHRLRRAGRLRRGLPWRDEAHRAGRRRSSTSPTGSARWP